MKNMRRKFFASKNKVAKKVILNITAGMLSLGMVFGMMSTNVLPTMNLSGSIYAAENTTTKTISYEFQSTDPALELPAKVLETLPEPIEGEVGAKVNVPHISTYKNVVLEGVTWKFAGYKDVEEQLGFFSRKYVYTVKDENDQKIVVLWNPVTTYSAKYEFVGKDGMQLPQAVKDKLPETVNGKEPNDVVQKIDIENVTVKEDGKDVTYYLDSWNENEHTFVDADFTFVATWAKFDSHRVSFMFESATAGQNLPQSVKDALPQDIIGLREGDALTLPQFTQAIGGDTANPGEWVFAGYENEPTVMGTEDIKLIGKWTFTEAGYTGSVIFVNDSGEQTVNYTDREQTLNYLNNLDEADKGGGFSKKYFVCWSDVPNYDGTKGKAFYSYEKIKDVFPNGLNGVKKLYPTYLSATNALRLANQISGKVIINKLVSAEDTMFAKLPVVKEGKRDFYLTTTLTDTMSVKMGASLETNPFIQAIVRNGKYFAPGGAEYYGNEAGESTAPNIKDMTEEEQYTFMDLHIKFDDRISLNDKLTFGLKSYSWYPHMILKNKLDADGNYEKFDNVDITVIENNPEGIITFAPGEEKEFIVRARVRVGRNNPKSVIDNPSFANVAEDMELVSKSDENFKVSKADLLAIARGEKEDIIIGGYIRGGAKLYTVNRFGLTFGGPTDIPQIAAEDILLGYKFNHVTFDKNSTDIEENVEQDLGTANVIHNMALGTDTLDTGKKPVHKTDATDKIILADTIADPPIDVVKNGRSYKFKEWNTKADGTGTSFTAETEVSEDITVYAIWQEENVVDGKVSPPPEENGDDGVTTIVINNTPPMDTPVKDSLPKTGETSHNADYAGLMILAIGAVVLLVLKRRESKIN